MSAIPSELLLTASKPRIARFAGVVRRILPILIPVAAIGAAAMVMHTMSQTVSYKTIVHILTGTRLDVLAMAVFATFLSYLSLIGRDGTILRFIGIRIKTPALLLGSVCGSALGNIAGLGPLSGGAVRYRIYGATGIRGEQITRLMAWITISFGYGLIVLSAASTLIAAAPVAAALGMDPALLRWGAAAVLLLSLSAFCFASKESSSIQIGRFRVERPTRGFLASQIVLTAVDLVCAGAALWCLLPAGAVGFIPFITIFASATALGVLSHVPGGLGVFETVILLTVGKSIPPGDIMAALIAYRLIYFFLPLVISAGLLATFELRGLPGHMSSPTMLRLRRSAGELAPSLLAVITFAIGVMLTISGATPAFTQRLAALETFLPLWVVESSQFLGSLLGVLLLFVARGLAARLDGAWWAAIGITILSLVLSLAKGLAFIEFSILLCLTLLLIATRRQFIRPAWLLRDPFSPGWFAAIAAALLITMGILFFAFHNVTYCKQLWWEFAFDAKAPRALRATIAAVVLAGILTVRQLLRFVPDRSQPPSQSDLAAATRIIRGQEHSGSALAIMGDKSFLFNQARTAFIMYARRGRSWVALYDPVGLMGDRTALIADFIALAHRNGGRAAFYQVRPDTLPLYLDAGLHLMKLGEEAIIDLGGFNLQGSSRSHLRYALKRGERDGLTFATIAGERSPAMVEDLQAISDGWLEERNAREKGFSVAGFDLRYVSAQSVALVYQDDRPVAFVTYMTTDLQTEATIGIMRHLPEASPYAMEFLFTHLALALKNAGCRSLSLGVVPLSGVSNSPLASSWHRVAGLVSRHCTAFYDFQGLRRFKSKFSPRWEPRYLAASGAIGQFVTLADVVALTNTRHAADECLA